MISSFRVRAKKFGEGWWPKKLCRVVRRKPQLYGHYGVVFFANELVTKYGDGLGPRILHAIGFEKAPEYREYSASFVEAKWAKSSRSRPVQLFFHKLNEANNPLYRLTQTLLYKVLVWAVFGLGVAGSGTAVATTPPLPYRIAPAHDVSSTAAERARAHFWSTHVPLETAKLHAAIDDQGVSGAYDIVHLDIHIPWFDSSNEVTSVCNVTIRWNEDHAPEFRMWIGQNGFRVMSVVEAETGIKLKWSYPYSNVVEVKLSEAPKKGHQITLQMELSGTLTCKGNSSLDCLFSGPISYLVAADFYPTNIVWADSFTADLRVTAAAGREIRATGIFMGMEPSPSSAFNNDWIFSHPFATRFLSIAVGAFESVPTGIVEIPWVWSLRTDKAKSKAQTIVNHTEGIADILRNRFGEVPYEKLDLIQLDNTFGGGVAPATTLFVGGHLVENLGGGADQRTALELVAHEVSHQWWGNAIAPQYPNGQVLSEGLAEYGASLVSQAVYHDRDMLKLNALLYTQFVTPAYDIPMAAQDVTQSWAYYPVIYAKGSVVMDMLAREVGEETFWAALRNLIETRTFDFVAIEDFMAHIQSWSSRDLTDFYDNWFYKSGYPELDVRVTTSPLPDGQWNVKVYITQSGADLYKLKIPLRLVLFGDAPPMEVDAFELIGKSKTRDYVIDGPLKAVQIDPEELLLQRTVAENKADLNLDGIANGSDLLDLAEHYDQHAKDAEYTNFLPNLDYAAQYDLNQNSRIDEQDLQLYRNEADLPGP